MRKLEGKVAVVTGAASGMGRAITILFIEQGASVVAVDINQERLGELSKVVSDSSRLITLTADLSKKEPNEKMIDLAIEKFGKLDILVNNAGVMDRFNAITETPDDLFDWVMSINVYAPFYSTRKAVGYFVENSIKGSVINVGSVGSIRGCRAGVSYITSKHALAGMTKNIAFTYAKDGIRTNLIAPGGVDTNILEGADYSKMPPKGFAASMSGVENNPRSGTSEEIANIALFLASDDSSFVNGATIVADSGWTCY